MIFRRLFGTKTQPAEVRASSAEPSPLPVEREVYTSTATVVVYDLESLKHRKDDAVDWWAEPADEVEELQKRNALILGLRADGFYDVAVTDSSDDAQQTFSLSFPSGAVFIGPGEELTGGGDEPTGTHGGFFVSVPRGDYKVAVSRTDECLRIGLIPAAAFENPKQPVILNA